MIFQTWKLNSMISHVWKCQFQHPWFSTILQEPQEPSFSLTLHKNSSSPIQRSGSNPSATGGAKEAPPSPREDRYLGGNRLERSGSRPVPRMRPREGDMRSLSASGGRNNMNVLLGVLYSLADGTCYVFVYAEMYVCILFYVCIYVCVYVRSEQ